MLLHAAAARAGREWQERSACDIGGNSRILAESARSPACMRAKQSPASLSGSRTSSPETGRVGVLNQGGDRLDDEARPGDHRAPRDVLQR